MSRTTLILTLALAISLLINVALLRRTPVPLTPSPRPPAAAAALPQVAEAETDVLFLREEVRKLREQLAVAHARREIERNRPDLSTGSDPEQQDARDFRELEELIASFIEERTVEARDDQGHAVLVQKAVLTPDHRQEVLRLLAEYAGLQGPSRASFEEQAQSALAAYGLAMDTTQRELFAAKKAGDNDEFFEDANVRAQAIYDRQAQRQETWMKSRIKPLQTLLERHDGVRPSLLSANVARLLMQLGAIDER